MQRNKLTIKSLHPSLKQTPITWQHVMANLVVSFSCIKFKSDANVILYFNEYSKTLQILTNGWGINTGELENIWNSNSEMNEWKNMAFLLGSSVTLESKLNGVAISSAFDLNDGNCELKLANLEADKFMKSFNTGTRLTISQLSIDISQKSFIELYNYLQLSLLPILTNEKLKFLMNWIDAHGIYSYDGNNFVPINKLTRTPYLNAPSLPEIEREISFELSAQQKVIEVNGFVISKYLSNGIFIYDGYQLISQINSSWLNLIDSTLINQFIYIQLDHITPNFLKNDFNWSSSVKQNFEQSLLKQLQIENSVIVDHGNELETTKIYLTKAFELSGNADHFADFEILKDKLKFVYKADDGKQITINLIKNKTPDNKEWLQMIPLQENSIEQIYEYDVNFNAKHPYFRTFNQRETQLKIEQFVICYAIAETICRLDGSGVTKLKYEIDKILRGKM